MRAVCSRVAAAGLLLLAALGIAQTLREVPDLSARVTDLNGTLGATERQALENRLRELEADTGSQLAVLLVDSTEPESIEQYALRVVEKWRLGRADVDDGVLVLVAVDDREMRIEVGYGLEGAIPDARANRIIDELITPRFADGDFVGGLLAGVDALADSIRGEELPAPERQGTNLPDIGGMLPILLILGLTVGGVLKRTFGAFPGAALTGGIVGLIVWFIVGLVATAVVAGIVSFIVILFMSAGPGSWSSGRGYGGGFGGGFGGRGGGFGGGGGSFGGGGASGSW